MIIIATLIGDSKNCRRFCKKLNCHTPLQSPISSHSWIQCYLLHIIHIKHILLVHLLSSLFQSRVWGVAYRVEGHDNVKKALGHLRSREQTLGGYQTRIVDFNPKETYRREVTIPVLVYYADPNNQYFLGGASYSEISTDILLSFGVNGSNIEYLLRLADFMRSEVTGEKDEHLFAIETSVRLKLNLCTKNIISWLELIKSSQFLSKLRDICRDNNENLLHA